MVLCLNMYLIITVKIRNIGEKFKRVSQYGDFWVICHHLVVVSGSVHIFRPELSK